VKLHFREWGDGDRTAVLLHGITSSAASWWKLGPALAAEGYHVIAPDLRGHGQSERGPYSVSAWAGDVLETVPPAPDLALGLSLGGLVLAAAVDRLLPGRAVYEDPAWFLNPDGERRAQSSAAFLARKQWTLDDIRATYPRWEPASHEGSLASIAQWDPETVKFEADFVEPAAPPVPSLVLTADPSELIPPPRAQQLRDLGFEVQAVPNTGHVIHNEDFDGFWAALQAWLTPAPDPQR
jgi:pimeloyl-ACP methyl ester carboxylesterase